MKKILIIEDNDDIRENLEEIFSLSNYNVITAENGSIGIKKALSESPNIILCDIAMPVKNGYEVLESLKNHNTAHQIPFVFLTASAQEKDIAMGKASKADYYLTKPFDTSDLLNIIKKLLKETV